MSPQVLALTRQRYGLGHHWWDASRVVSRLKTTCDSLGIPLVIPLAALVEAESSGRQPYFPEDGHWSETGHRIAAGELARGLGRLGLVPCAPPASP